MISELNQCTRITSLEFEKEERHSVAHGNLLATQRSKHFALLRLLGNAPGATAVAGWSSE
jgi:hypothetical protein